MDNDYKDKYEELVCKLESLSPGGSEFHNDPDKCLEWISNRLESAGKIAAERNYLRELLGLGLDLFG